MVSADGERDLSARVGGTAFAIPYLPCYRVVAEEEGFPTQEVLSW